MSSSSDEAGQTSTRAHILPRVPSAARPTLRCLREDLVEDWDDIQQRAALGTQPITLPAFDALNHPVVRHAAEVFPGGADVDARRETISGLSNPVWYKLKTGRWRGAVYINDDGQAWICA